jgi:transcriptional antiterminator NusG
MSNINEKNRGPKWYVAHTYTGYVDKVKLSIEKVVENRGLGHLIYDVRVPVATIVEKTEDGEEKIIENKIFPSYVLVKMTMTDESWHVVRNITGVTGFVGPGSEPTPLTEAEIAMFNVEEGVTEASEAKFSVGDKVEVISGPLAGFFGTLQAINEDSDEVEVLVATGRRDIVITVETKGVRLAAE